MEYEQLNRLLRDTGGNLREVARRLGIARSTVYNKMKDYRISLESFRAVRLMRRKDMSTDMSKYPDMYVDLFQ